MSINDLRLKQSKILIVDDAEFSRCVIGEIFANQGYTNIETAVDGVDGVEKTKSFEPDIVLLDLMMPKMDGFEFCEIVRKDPRFARLPILVQSASTNAKHMSRAFSVGATDFVNKPINSDEITARARVHLEHQMFSSELTRFQNRVASELKEARKLQDTIMPSAHQCKEIGDWFDISIASFFEPSSEIGGDFWGVRRVSAHELAVFNVDLSGHGISAAINTFRLHTLIEENDRFFTSPSDSLGALNGKMHKLLPTGQFATMFYAVINTEKDTLTFSAAGAPDPFIFRANGEVDRLDASGMPIAIAADTDYPEVTVPFKKGDTLLLYSDALIETENAEGVFFDDDRVMASCAGHRGKSAQVILSKLVDDFHEHFNEEPDDDLTVCVYTRN
jgi:sigma-B regulation protein RsbU (phosphoserine phosphatase)